MAMNTLDWAFSVAEDNDNTSFASGLDTSFFNEDEGGGTTYGFPDTDEDAGVSQGSTTGSSSGDSPAEQLVNTINEQFKQGLESISSEEINQPIMDFHEQFSSQLATNAQLALEQRTSDIEAYVAGTQESRTGVVQDSIREVQRDIQNDYLKNLSETTLSVAGALQEGVKEAAVLEEDFRKAFLGTTTSAYAHVMDFLVADAQIQANLEATDISASSGSSGVAAAEVAAESREAIAEMESDLQLELANKELEAAQADAAQQQELLDLFEDAAGDITGDIGSNDDDEGGGVDALMTDVAEQAAISGLGPGLFPII